MLPDLIQRAAAQDDIASLKWHLSAFTRLETISSQPCPVRENGRLQVPGPSSSSSHRPSITSTLSAQPIIAPTTESISPLDECYPLHIASSKGHITCVKALLSAGSSVHLRDYTDHTPLYLAAKHGHSDVVRSLREAGAHLADEEVKLVKWTLSGKMVVNGESTTKAIWKEAGLSLD